MTPAGVLVRRIGGGWFRPDQLPIVNVVAVLVVLISIVPVYLAHRPTREEGGAAGRGAAAEATAEATAIP